MQEKKKLLFKPFKFVWIPIKVLMDSFMLQEEAEDHSVTALYMK